MFTLNSNKARTISQKSKHRIDTMVEKRIAKYKKVLSKPKSIRYTLAMRPIMKEVRKAVKKGLLECTFVVYGYTPDGQSEHDARTGLRISALKAAGFNVCVKELILNKKRYINYIDSNTWLPASSITISW